MLTSVSIALMKGKRVEPSLDDHRRLNPRKKNRANNTESPRTREGKVYPGGKHMRSALKNLARRRKALDEQKDKQGCTVPGSMK